MPLRAVLACSEECTIWVSTPPTAPLSRYACPTRSPVLRSIILTPPQRHPVCDCLCDASNHQPSFPTAGDLTQQTKLPCSSGAQPDAAWPSLLCSSRGLHSLVHLDLTQTQLGAANAVKLARALREAAALQHLDLTNCGIGDAGWEALAGVLEATTALRSLDINRSASAQCFLPVGGCGVGDWV